MLRSIAMLAGGCAVALALLAPAPARAADNDLRKEIEELKRGQQEIRKQLDEIKALIQARPAAAAAVLPGAAPIAGKILDLGANPIRGAETARLTMIEFSDYQ